MRLELTDKQDFFSNLAGTVAYYHVEQNAYLAGSLAGSVPTAGAPTAGTKCSTVSAASSNCKGSEYALFFLLDYQWTKRLDVYGGVMYSKASGGYRNGFPATDTNADNTTVTIASRLRF